MLVVENLQEMGHPLPWNKVVEGVFTHDALDKRPVNFSGRDDVNLPANARPGFDPLEDPWRREENSPSIHVEITGGGPLVINDKVV